MEMLNLITTNINTVIGIITIVSALSVSSYFIKLKIIDKRKHNMKINKSIINGDAISGDKNVR